MTSERAVEPVTYPEGAVVRVEDMGPVERAYAEAMHEGCEDGPPHPMSAHSPWSGGDLDGTEPWPSFMDRLTRHGLTLSLVTEPEATTALLRELAAWNGPAGYWTQKIATAREPVEAGHRTTESHDCFLMNCRDLGEEVAALQERLAAARGEPELGLRTALLKLNRTYSRGKVTLDADAFDDLVLVATPTTPEPDQ